MFIFTPIFVAGRIIAFAGTVAHHLDLGGGNPGMTPDAVDVHAEGIIIPPSRYTYDRDWNGGPLERLVAANVRVPSQTIGDFYAQFAANAIGTARMEELAARYGVPNVLAAMSELMNYSERRFQAALEPSPTAPIMARMRSTTTGSTISRSWSRRPSPSRASTIAVDYAGSCGQVRAQPQLPVGLDRLGHARGNQVGADQSRHPLQRGLQAADQP